MEIRKQYTLFSRGMAHVNTLVSKRAKRLMALCEEYPSSPTTSELSPISSCSSESPIPAWWHRIFEASDIPSIVNNSCTTKICVNTAKRKLSLSPVKAYKIVAPVQSEESPSAKLSFPKENTQCEHGLRPNASQEIEIGCLIPSTQSCTSIPALISSVPDNIECNPNQLDVKTSLKATDDCETGKAEVNSCKMVTCHVMDEDVRHRHQNEACELQLFPSQMKIMAAKLALNAGKKHITIQGKLRKARSLKPPCVESCKRCAAPKLTLSERQEINSVFWALKDHVKQWTFIHGSVVCAAPKRKICASGIKGEKLCSRTYQLTVGGTPRRVCKTMFKSTLSICDSWIDSAISHYFDGEMTRDKRGRKCNDPQ